MRRLLLLSVMFFVVLVSKAQEKVWLPEAFVRHALAGDSMLVEYLKPIEFILDPPDSGLWVYGAKGEDAAKKPLKRVIHEGREKWSVPISEYGLDTTWVPHADIERFAKADIYLSRNDNKLLLEIVEPNRTERIDFIDSMNGDKFSYGFEAIAELFQRSASKVWMPETFVQRAVAGDTALDQHLKPFVFVFEPLDCGNFLAYEAGDPRLTGTRRVVHNGQEKIQVLSPSVLFPIRPELQDYVARLERSQLYLSKQAGKVVLEIVEGDTTERIEYTDRVYGRVVSNGWIEMNKLLGRYRYIK
ncbi:hypothetical protein [Polluticoccus soli]|uniref:hypothetical protein n=1 Tax=Polluticoccus soli TaxID=3034150 RepID=UPI0023E20D8B|nr:hypothetical protein [Flavipsychrobacter sp. JY13-12]